MRTGFDGCFAAGKTIRDVTGLLQQCESSKLTIALIVERVDRRLRVLDLRWSNLNTSQWRPLSNNLKFERFILVDYSAFGIQVRFTLTIYTIFSNEVLP